MEGSPVRGQRRSRNIWIREALDAQSFESELVGMIAAELQHAEVIFARAEPDSNSLQLPSWMKAHLERHPALYKKLEQGELVGISHADQDKGPRPATRSSVLLFPIISDSVLYGVIGLVSAMDSSQLPQDDLELVKHTAHQAGPVLARLSEIERLRSENRYLKSLVQMRSHLQANIAHELRTPLAAVRGYARMILDGRAGQTNDTQKEYLRVVGDNTTRLINLVSWMTHIIEISAQDFEISKFDLRELWMECVHSGKPHNITQQIPEESFGVMADRRKLSRVFDLLIAASTKFATDDSNILVQFSHGREREVTVKISDGGAIIPSEFLIRVFDRSLSSVPMPLAHKPETSEIGLSDIYDIIGMHGGRFFVNSKTGQGLTFLFTLPAVGIDGEEEPGHEQAVNSGR